MAYKSTRRHWVKLWVNEWLDGTTRFELTPEQRLLWVDLLALAGRSRFPGMIFAGVGKSGKYVGYPVSYLSGLLGVSPELFRSSCAVLEEFSRVILRESAPDCVVITICNWDKYQSEYQRQKSQRIDNTDVDGDSHSEVRTKTQQSAQDVTSIVREKCVTEGEGEGEGEKEVEVDAAKTTAAAFAAIGFEQPFGQPKFQAVWLRHYIRVVNGELEWLTMAMEATIQECNTAGIGVPPQFFTAKHGTEVNEQDEFKQRYRGKPPL